MPRPCLVCRSLRRAEIDLRLARQQCNVTEIARELGCAPVTVRRHREQHTPGFLKVYGASPELPSKGQLHGELMRLYTSVLDNLAMAEAGTLEGLDENGRERRRVSHTAVQGYVREARALVGDISALAADAGDAEDLPTGMPRGELARRIMERLDAPRVHNDAVLEQPDLDTHMHDDALKRITMHSLSATPHTLSHPDDPSEAAARPTRGGQAGGAGTPSPSQMSNDAVMAPKTPDAQTAQSDLPGIQAHPRLQQVIRDHNRTTHAEQTPADSPAVLTAPNPNYPGSAAASSEERAAAGYPDVELTLDDIRSMPPELARLMAEHRASDPTPTPEA